MKMRAKVVSFVVAGLVASGAMALSAQAEEVDKTFSCEGGNECKQKGECSQVDHSCHAMNKCRGKGMIFTVDKKACDAAIAKASGKKPAKKKAVKKT